MAYGEKAAAHDLYAETVDILQEKSDE